MNQRKLQSLKVGIICSRFNEFVVNALLDGARRNLAKHGVKEKNIEVFWVPGAYEIPVMARLMAVSQKYDALVALGAVIRGETAHFDYVAGPCADGIMQVQLETLVPIGFG
ncbi:MAG: 6,7-dimethyl-8-ribityllumazine synthase, partial [Ilumatobacteraceae bacterium]